YRMIENYHYELNRLSHITNLTEKRDNMNKNEAFIKWGDRLRKRFLNGDKILLDDSNLMQCLYRPFTRKWVFYDENVVDRPGRTKKIFSNSNIAIVTTGISAKKGFSAIITSIVPDTNLMQAGGQVYPLYDRESDMGLIESKYNINENISKRIGLSVEDTFYYIYGLFHSPDYKEQYANDLSKSLPRIPIVKNIKKYVELGYQLA